MLFLMENMILKNEEIPLPPTCIIFKNAVVFMCFKAQKIKVLLQIQHVCHHLFLTHTIHSSLHLF